MNNDMNSIHGMAVVKRINTYFMEENDDRFKKLWIYRKI